MIKSIQALSSIVLCIPLAINALVEELSLELAHEPHELSDRVGFFSLEHLTRDLNKDLIKAVQSSNVSEVTALLLHSTVDVVYQDERGNTPLIIASINGNDEIVSLLINAMFKRGLSQFLIHVNKDGLTAINAAARQGHTHVVRLLFKALRAANLIDIPI